MPLLQPLDLRVRKIAADLVPRGAREQAAAHADEPVDLPGIDLDAGVVEDALPRQRVAVDRVDQSAVEIEDDRAHYRRPRATGTGRRSAGALAGGRTSDTHRSA